METWLLQLLLIVATLVLVLLNGFFVAAEFALVKVRGGRLAEMAREGKPFARTAQWIAQRLDRSLSACQLGITMASLGLGWIGEPAIARMLEPAFRALGATSPLRYVTCDSLSHLVVVSTPLSSLWLLGARKPAMAQQPN